MTGSQNHRICPFSSPGHHGSRYGHACSAGWYDFVTGEKEDRLFQCDSAPGAVYLKNMVTQNWQEREAEPGQPLPFHIHEQDRAMIRDAIVDAMVLAPELVRYLD